MQKNKLWYTSEMVSNEKRVEIIDNYAEKLNCEYPLDQTRNILNGGLKGCGVKGYSPYGCRLEC